MKAYSSKKQIMVPTAKNYQQASPLGRLIGNAGRGGCPQDDCPQSKYFRRDNISIRENVRIFLRRLLRTLLFTVFTCQWI